MSIAEQMNEILRLSKLQDKKDAETASEIAALKKEISRYSDRDGNAHIELIYLDDNPFNKIDLRICDFGVADNIYVCESDEVMALKDKAKALTDELNVIATASAEMLEDQAKCYERRIKELEAANAKYKSALENIIIWAKGSTCEMCGVKEMTETDAYDIASEALKED